MTVRTKKDPSDRSIAMAILLVIFLIGLGFLTGSMFTFGILSLIKAGWL